MFISNEKKKFLPFKKMFVNVDQPFGYDCSSHSDASFDYDYRALLDPALFSIVSVWKRSPTHTRLVSYIVVVYRLALPAAVIHYPQDHNHNHML